MSIFWTMGVGAHSVRASIDASEAAGKARAVGHSVERLEDRLDRTLLACEAMWTILRDKLGVTDTELIDRITELDLSDGKLDGKVGKTAALCPSCERTVSRRFSRCMYCGQEVAPDPFT